MRGTNDGTYAVLATVQTRYQRQLLCFLSFPALYTDTHILDLPESNKFPKHVLGEMTDDEDVQQSAFHGRVALVLEI